jgi:hypothetical protein
MSYEGYTQHICKHGHRFDRDAYDSNNICDFCGTKSVFENSVDETNCDSVGIIPPFCWLQLQISPEKTEICNLGHVHIVEYSKYRIPTNEELPMLRGYLERWKYIPLEKDSPFYNQ